MPNTKYVTKTGPATPFTERGLSSDRYDVGMYRDANSYPNFYLEVRPTKSKRFLFIYFRKGKQVRISLGVYGPGKTSLKRARELAAQYNDLLADGIDVRSHLNDEKAKEAGIPTFRAFAESQLKVILPGLKKHAQYQMQLNLIHSDYCKPIHDKRIDRIDERTIADILQPIWIDKKATADKLLVHLREIFRRARVNYKNDLTYNPCDKDLLVPLLPRRPTLAKNEGHHRSIPWQRIPELMQRLQADDTTASLCLQFLAIHGLRSANALGARWSYIDLDASPMRMTTPGTEMKGGNDFSTPLTSRSLAILEKMDERRSACDSKFIFPGQYGRRLGSTNLLNLSNRLTKDTDLQTSIHGLRSTMRTWIGEMGYDFAVGESQLDHTVGTAATRAYTYSAEYLGRRLEMVQAWEDFIYSKVNSQTTGRDS